MKYYYKNSCIYSPLVVHFNSHFLFWLCLQSTIYVNSSRNSVFSYSNLTWSRTSCLAATPRLDLALRWIDCKSDACREYLETCENTLQMDLRCETCPWCLISYAASVWWCQAANGRAESRMKLHWHYTSCLLAYGSVYQLWPIISNPFATPSLDELQCVPEQYMIREVVDVKACNSRHQLLL